MRQATLLCHMLPAMGLHLIPLKSRNSSQLGAFFYKLSQVICYGCINSASESRGRESGRQEWQVGVVGDTGELPGVMVGCPVLWVFWLRCSGKRQQGGYLPHCEAQWEAWLWQSLALDSHRGNMFSRDESFNKAFVSKKNFQGKKVIEIERCFSSLPPLCACFNFMEAFQLHELVSKPQGSTCVPSWGYWC